MQKGVVMEITPGEIVLLTRDGQFIRIPRGSRECEIGDEIQLVQQPAPVRGGSFRMRALVSGLVAACVLLVMGLAALFGRFDRDPVIMAYVTLDINPSVEMGIDTKERVRELTGINPEGAALISGLDYNGKTVAQLTAELVALAEQQGYLKKVEEVDIVVSTTPVIEASEDEEDKLVSAVSTAVAESLPPEQKETATIISRPVPVEVRQEALVHGISAGKYAIYLEAKKKNPESKDIDLNAFKTKSVSQLAKEAGGVSKLIDEKNRLSKDDLRRLVLAEKEREKEEKDKNKGKATPTPAKNAPAAAKPTSFRFIPTPTVKQTPNRNYDWLKRDDDEDRRNSGSRNDNGNADRRGGNSGNRGDSKDDGRDRGKGSGKAAPTPTVKLTATPKSTAKPTVKPTSTPAKRPNGDDRDRDRNDDRDRNNNKNDRDRDDRRDDRWR
ncbi:anti-sigma factor domain-containing protein [Paenibacillus thermoaerophilus]|uniref:Anti-sigma factor domain-containing protein n=1 Tax=Paenibacillus thermoaerophilus TaxID=1215385 RepID=A0ABW2V6G9_9BACL|nr:anti-sigma factor domain-containing protein [Paenibacillus thermoaerophilus]TMV15936.1 anti-sigma factor domain-containing protein [Paenibacillus thermoaerophilus]